MIDKYQANACGGKFKGESVCVKISGIFE